jgi:predicted DNA-binding helix-hairpin-helix protein
MPNSSEALVPINININVWAREKRRLNRAEISSKTAEEADKMGLLRYHHLPTLFLLAALAGCTRPQDPQELREKTAQATAEVKRDARAVAAGIREGWSRDKPLDLNTATKEQLLSLPGMTSAEANRVIAGRPYQDPSEVVKRRIISKVEYDKIADRVTAGK